METNSSLMFENKSNIFKSIPKPKIIKNLPIQKAFSNTQKKGLEKKIIDQIVNDPDLALIVSPPISKDEVLFKSTDKATQMTDRIPSHPSAKITLSNASNQTNDNIESKVPNSEPKENDLKIIEKENFGLLKAIEVKADDSKYDLSTCTSKKIFESVNENCVSSHQYTSPLFKATGLTSQVFKQRINFRVMKLNAFNTRKDW